MRKCLLLFILLALAGCTQEAEETPSSPLAAVSVPAGDVMDDETLLRLSADIAKNPQDDLAYRRRGDEFYHRGQYDKAIADYTTALHLKPDAKTFYNRGVQYSAKGMFDAAIRDYTEAIQLDPSATEPLYNRGTAYYQRGES